MMGDISVNIGSGNGMSPEQHQAIAWINVGILSYVTQEKISGIWIKLHTFLLKKTS